MDKDGNTDKTDLMINIINAKELVEYLTLIKLIMQKEKDMSNHRAFHVLFIQQPMRRPETGRCLGSVHGQGRRGGAPRRVIAIAVVKATTVLSLPEGPRHLWPPNVEISSGGGLYGGGLG